ncbi:MAG: chemotaxis protein [Campylobacterales bacterium]
MSLHEKKVLKAGSNEMELVDFRIYKKDEGGQIYEGIYGINVAKVREIIKMPKLTKLPDAPEFVEGIFDLRGVVIPVINLARWMHIEQPDNLTEKPKVIITEFNNILIGFTVNEAKRIRRINWKDIEPASFGSTGSSAINSRVTGVTKIENDDVLLILDFEGIVEELGIFQPKLEGTKELQTFSGLALALDDSLTARRIVRGLLEKMGFTVIEATDGEEGLQKLEELAQTYGAGLKDQLKIIVSDVEMPRMDGYHFASRVKQDERFSSIPIVFNSSISDHFASMRAEEVQGEGYLVKFEADKFYQEIARVVAKQAKS